MGRSAPENDGDVHFSLLALVDLRSFSQDELRLAARCSSKQNLKQDIVIPDIDPSIFNESSGSRKQSYSVYPLAVSLNYEAVLKEAARNPKNNSKTVESSSKSKENNVQWNEQSVSGKRKSPEVKEEDRAGSYSSGSQHKLKKIRLEEEVQPQPSDDKENLGTEIIIESSLESNIQQVERNVEVNSSWQPEHVERNVDVNSNRQHKQVPPDPIEAKMIKCLGKMKGTWTSKQRRRKIVEAKGFPKGWMVTVGLRKARRNSNGRASLEFYNYKSPDGKELPSFKEASAYLLSKFGTRPILEWSKKQKFLGAKSIHVSKDKSTYTCSSCRNTFGSKKLLLKHKSKTGHGNNNLIDHDKHMNLDTAHTQVPPIGAKEKSVMGNHITSLSFVDASRQKNVSNRAHGDEKTSFNVSQVSIECGICHKFFTNKRKYWGHLGAHSSSRVHNVFECEHCHKTFTKKSQYWGHLRKHYKKPSCNALVGKETRVMETISPPKPKQDFVLPKNSQVGIPNVNHLHNTMEDGISRGTKFVAALEVDMQSSALEVDMQSSKILGGDIGWCSEGCYICEKKIDVVDAIICSWCEKEFHLMCVGKTIKDDEWICPSCAF